MTREEAVARLLQIYREDFGQYVGLAAVLPDLAAMIAADAVPLFVAYKVALAAIESEPAFTDASDRLTQNTSNAQPCRRGGVLSAGFSRQEAVLFALQDAQTGAGGLSQWAKSRCSQTDTASCRMALRT